jgi:glycerol uptake facilitator-like aquaporin
MTLPAADWRRALAEAVGTALLLVAVVGSGIMGVKLAQGSVHLALLANAIATGGALVALIVCFGHVSGAHFNPLVSLAMAWRRRLSWREAGLYIVAQCAGGIAGVLAAHFMFELPLLQLSGTARSGTAQWFSEALASFGLLTVIFGCRGESARYAPFVVGAWITGAYWFTSSTSFANPAVTLARSLTDTFSGILPADAPAFMLAQLVGAGLAVGLETVLRGSRDA